MLSENRTTAASVSTTRLSQNNGPKTRPFSSRPRSKPVAPSVSSAPAASEESEMFSFAYRARVEQLLQNSVSRTKLARSRSRRSRGVRRACRQRQLVRRKDPVCAPAASLRRRWPFYTRETQPKKLSGSSPAFSRSARRMRACSHRFIVAWPSCRSAGSL